MPDEAETKIQNRINNAVTEALKDQTVSNIQQQLSEIRQQIKEGFAGVHQKQDFTNGKVLKARDDITDLKNETGSLKEKMSFVYKLIIGIGATVGVALLAAWIKLIIK
jgi:hypothetical protein